MPSRCRCHPRVFASPALAQLVVLLMMVVTTQADHRQMGVYGVQVVYHFESHPIE